MNGSVALLPPAVLGVLGGGQLGRFFVLAALEMGYQTWVLDPDPMSPAGRIAHRHLCNNYDDPAALRAMAETCAAITTEFENVPATALAELSRALPVRPGDFAVGVCQDRIAEKKFFRSHDLPHSPCAFIKCASDISEAKKNADLLPGILKVARLGYDGKGQTSVTDWQEVASAFKSYDCPCVLEKKLPLERELSVILARSDDGSMVSYPVIENVHVNGILDSSMAPACLLEGEQSALATKMAGRIAEAINYCGVLAVELFVSGGQLFVNEMAPRPHNSGHHTLDACNISQYELQVRALCALGLPQPVQHYSSVMINLLGDLWYPNGVYQEPNWGVLLARPNDEAGNNIAAHLHLYGKDSARHGRKMGHFTLTDSNNAADGNSKALLARAKNLQRSLTGPAVVG